MAQEQSSFRCEHLSCVAFETEHPWHFHPAFALTWIVRSHGTRYVGDSAERYAPGDLVLIGPNLPRCWRNDAVDCGAESPQWNIAQFNPSCFGAGFLSLTEAASVPSLLDKAQFGLAASLIKYSLSTIGQPQGHNCASPKFGLTLQSTGQGLGAGLHIGEPLAATVAALFKSCPIV